MPRLTKIRQARSSEEFRDALVERWRQIFRRRPKAPEVANPDEPPPPPRSPGRAHPGGRVFEDVPRRHGLGRGVFDDDDE